MEMQMNETTNENTVPIPEQFPDDTEFNAAYERRLAEIKAVPDDALVSLNLDVHEAIATVLGALPEILALRSELAKLPQLDLSRLDSLEDFAEAAGEANSRFVMAMTPEEDIVALNAEGTRIREIFHADAVALVTRKLLDRSVLSKFEGLTGYKNVGFDLIDWATVMRDSWPVIQGKSGLSVEEVVKAKEIGQRLVRAAGLREQGPATIADVARVRNQAVSLLVNAYDEVRRGITFLRWNAEDVDTIAPSLYATKGRGKRPGAGQEPEPVAPTPAQPLPAAQVAAPAQGLPGALPFVNV